MLEEAKNADVWKYIATSAVSIVLAGMVFFVISPKNVVTEDQLRRDMPGYITQYSTYTQDAKDISSRLAAIDKTLTIMQARQEQQASDIAVIASKSHVTAHPVQDGPGNQ